MTPRVCGPCCGAAGIEPISGFARKATSRTTTTIPTKSQAVSGPQADIAAGSRDDEVEESCRTVRRPGRPRHPREHG